MMSTVDPQPASRESRGVSHAPGADVPDALAELDWHEIACQSESGCANRATHIVYRHAVDDCNRPNLDPSGNIIDILCISCVRAVKAQVLKQVDRMTRCPGAYCLTCGAPVQKLSDVLRKTVQLRSYA
jgi:hypothetical protein